MKIGLFTSLLLLVGPVAANPGIRLVNPSTIEVCWPGESGKQYGLFCSTDLKTWSPLGEVLEGIDGPMSVLDEISGTPEKYYRVEEFGGDVLDLTRFKFGTVGNSWVYEVVSESLLGNESFTWETEIIRRTVVGGENVLEWIFNRDGFWDQSIYLLDDFTTGIYEVGGQGAGEPLQLNTPPVPSLLASFTSGAVVPVTYFSGTDSVSDEITITVEQDALVVAAGTFQGVVKVEHNYQRSLQGFPVTGTTIEWFAEDVGLVLHVGSVDVFGSIATTTFELRSYDVE